jgi:hypothetical protein
MIADGVYYTMNAEHSADEPIKRGWYMHAINITTGEPIWQLPGTQSGSTDGSRVFQGAIADGYLAYSDAYDCIEYVVGKGLSQATITAPDVAVPIGTGIVIKGTITDQSPGQPGTPCVSKDSMTLQMEHLHWQMPIDGIYHNETIKGVPISIDTIDQNDAITHIQTVTSDGYSGEFSYTWEPTVAGNYKITATFAGDDSYASSFATTAVTVDPAPTVTPPPAQQTIPDYTNTFNIIIAAIVIAILIGVVNLAVYFRKRN